MKQKKTSSMEIQGKLPPQALDIEEAVLGAILISPDSYSSVSSLLNKESFYSPANSLVYEAIQSLVQKSNPIDIVTVTNELRTLGRLEEAGGVVYVMQLTNRIASAANIEAHARILVEKYIGRQLAVYGQEVTGRAYDETTDVFDLLGLAQKLLEDINATLNTGSFYAPKHIIKEMLTDVEQRMKSSQPKGLVSSIYAVQKKLNGYYPDELIIIGGRPGSGKTAFMLSELYHWANSGYPVCVFSLEMSKEQLLFRIAAVITGIDVKVLSKQKVSEEEWMKLNSCIRAIEELKIYIDDTPAMNIQDIRSKCRMMKSKHNIKLFAVDYLQLISVSGKNMVREQEISTISRTLKLIAKENHTPVMALSQMSRDVDKRGGNGKPKLSDLRESGAIEQDADVVAFTWRPHEYDPQNFSEDLGYLVVAKNRNGSLGDCKMRWIKEKTYYTNYAESVENHYDPKSPNDEPF